MNGLYVLFVIAIAAVGAKLEIEIEGAHGWAANLPTWKIEKHALLDRIYGGRPLTGYHVWASVFLLLVFHMPFFWTGAWFFRGELRVLGGMIVFWLLEDFLWFVLNPHFGWKKFSPAYAWWHRRWRWGLPVEYWTLGVPGLLLFFLP